MDFKAPRDASNVINFVVRESVFIKYKFMRVHIT